VIRPHTGEQEAGQAYTGNGILINSGFLTGLDVQEARHKAIEHLQKEGIGQAQTTYRLRDWCVSRQRYWGCPIPIIQCSSCGAVPVPDQDLPVTLPKDVTFDLMGNPLDHHPTWKHVPCPQCGQAAQRETDTLDTFFESSWYFLRFCDPKSTMPINGEMVDKWMPVDWYIGGVEHAVLHLLYARFFTKALRDCGYISLSEPFKNLMTQGMVCHQTFQDPDGKWLFPFEVAKTKAGTYVTVQDGRPVMVGRSEKMSKSKKNVVDPQEMVETYGADAVRLFVLSDTPPEKDFDWSGEGIEGCWRYLNRLWDVVDRIHGVQERSGTEEASLKFRKTTHQFIDKITESFETNAFNKAIAFARELTREIDKGVSREDISAEVLGEGIQVLLLALYPIIPHITSDLWSQVKGKGVPDHLMEASWPVSDPSLAAKETITIIVQVNGKLRGNFLIAPGSEEKTMLETALTIPNVQREIAGKAIRKTIIVPDRIVNIVV
jgi:leucyl-tRNA synthetase